MSQNQNGISIQFSRQFFSWESGPRYLPQVLLGPNLVSGRSASIKAQSVMALLNKLGEPTELEESASYSAQSAKCRCETFRSRLSRCKKNGQNNERINSSASNLKVEETWCGKVSHTSLIIAPFVSLELQMARYPYCSVQGAKRGGQVVNIDKNFP